MAPTLFEVDSFKPFSESLLWQINRDYYQSSGIEAWSKGIVPHQITSNSLAGRTYAELIIGYLKDIAAQGRTQETVYVVELGAGHGRLGYHILRHLEQMTTLVGMELPPYCYVLTDIVEENLRFFKEHPQLQSYYASGRLDYAYYDAVDGESLTLRHAGVTIRKGELWQSMVALGNYFFDSIPNDLYHIQKDKISKCSVALHSSQHPASLQPVELLQSLRLTYRQTEAEGAYYGSELFNSMLQGYQEQLTDSYLFFPEKGMLCIENLRALTTEGLMLLSMDKGFHDIAKLDHMSRPEIVTHGSFSLWVNYHALGSYCERLGGKALFPTYSTFHLQVVCLLCTDRAAAYTQTNAAYQHSVNDFGPDDFNTIKKLSYDTVADLSLMHLIALLRLSAYDSAFFAKILPQVKVHVQRLTVEERDRLSQSLDLVWSYYFNINENQDLALKIAGIFFDLGFYEKALVYYQHSTDVYGAEADTYYNKILCYFQLRQDAAFVAALAEATLLFPDTDLFDQLHEFDLTAE